MQGNLTLRKLCFRRPGKGPAAGAGTVPRAGVAPLCCACRGGERPILAMEERNEER